MAHHSLRRAVGTWVGVVTSGDFEFFDAMQYASIDGDAGGTWNPTDWIRIGGTNGVRIYDTAAFRCDGPSSLLGDVKIGTTASDDLSCQSLARFYATLHANADMYVHEDLNVDGNCDLCASASNSYIVRGVGHFYENVTFDKNVTCNGNTVIGNASSDTLTVNAIPTFANGINVPSYSGFGASPAGSDRMIINSDVETYGALQFGGSTSAQVVCGITIKTSPLSFDDGGYIQRRSLFTSASAPTVSVLELDVVVASSATVVFLASEGGIGACIDVVNTNSSSIDIRESTGGHTLRTLPAHTSITLMRSGSSGSYGWQSLGERTYVALV